MRRPFILGLTGSMGMGKSTTAAMFAEHGVPVWDADAAVHRLYSRGGAAVAPLSAVFPAALTDHGIDRVALRRSIASDPTALGQIEAIVHPLVSADRAAFLAAQDADIVLLDIPLLYEGGSDALCDAVAVVSAPEAVQRARILARGSMSEAELDLILSRQMPDSEKRARATWIIDTSTMDSARRAMQAILAQIRKAPGNA